MVSDALPELIHLSVECLKIQGQIDRPLSGSLHVLQLLQLPSLDEVPWILPIFQGTTKIRTSSDVFFDLGDGSTHEGILQAQLRVDTAVALLQCMECGPDEPEWLELSWSVRPAESSEAVKVIQVWLSTLQLPWQGTGICLLNWALDGSVIDAISKSPSPPLVQGRSAADFSKICAQGCSIAESTWMALLDANCITSLTLDSEIVCDRCPPTLAAFCCTVQRPFKLLINLIENNSQHLVEELKAAVAPFRLRVGFHDVVQIGWYRE